MKEVPSGGDLLIYILVDACNKAISSVISIFTFRKSGSSPQTDASSSSKNQKDKKQPKKNSYPIFEDHTLYDLVNLWFGKDSKRPNVLP